MTVTSASESPLPPKRSGTAMPSQPSSAISLQSSRSTPDSDAICLRTVAVGLFSRKKAVAVSSSMVCSSVKVILVLSCGITSVLRESEHALTDDIGLDLAGAAADRRRERIEIRALPQAAVDCLAVADEAHGIRAL